MTGRYQDLQIKDVEFDRICTSLPPIKISISGGDIGGSRNEEEQECRTPTSEENKIPVKLECPPAPKKPIAVKREKSTIYRKRKSLQNGEEFFEVVNRIEVDAFFRVLEGAGSRLSPSRPVVKRRRIRAGL